MQLASEIMSRHRSALSSLIRLSCLSGSVFLEEWVGIPIVENRLHSVKTHKPRKITTKSMSG